uniref:SAM-dependent methyltransferase n=3 Tax=Bursaphelenchus xylophilus TaxID=6326 RepID=A0A1I7SI26_BURXY
NRIALWTIRKILKLMGFAAVDLASNEGERAKLMVDVDEWQVAQEASEKVEADDLNQLEAKLERILQEDRARHKALAEGEDA